MCRIAGISWFFAENKLLIKYINIERNQLASEGIVNNEKISVRVRV